MKQNLFATSKRLLTLTGLASLGALILLVGSLVLVRWQTGELEVLYQDLYTTARKKESLLITAVSGKVAEGSSEKLATAFVPESDLASMLQRFEDTGRSAKIDLEVVSAEVGAEAGSGIKLSFKMTGSFSNLYNFLQLVENLPYVLRFDGLSLTARGEGWSGDLQLTILSFLSQQ